MKFSLISFYSKVILAQSLVLLYARADEFHVLLQKADSLGTACKELKV